MGAHKMLGSPPPFQMSQKVWGLLGRGPRATCQRSYPMTDAQIDPFNTSGVQPSREAHPRPRDREICLCPEAHHVRDSHQLTPPGALFHLAVDQTRRHLPTFALSSLDDAPREPVSKMGREGREIHM